MRKDSERASNSRGKPVPARAGVIDSEIQCVAPDGLACPITMILATSLITSARLQAAPLPSSAEYLPSVGDIEDRNQSSAMSNFWHAEQADDWGIRVLYEPGNLQLYPYRDMIASVTEQPFKELNSAIDAEDDVVFVKAYGDLTDACNSCHQPLNHRGVVIGVPVPGLERHHRCATVRAFTSC